MNATEIEDVHRRMDSLITETDVPMDKVMELMKAFSEVEVADDAAKLARHRSLNNLVQTLQWRSPKNNPGGKVQEKARKSFYDLHRLLKHNSNLTPVQEQVTRDGKTFTETYYVKQGEDQGAQPGGGGGGEATSLLTGKQPAKEPAAPKGWQRLPAGMPVDSASLQAHMLSQGFIPADPNLPADTRDVHMVNGNWTPERTALHTKIAGSFLDKAKPVPMNQKPVAMVMMGGPGSGKSSANKNFDLNNFVPCDPDAIKEQLPEYNQALKSKALNAAAMVHEESSHLNNFIREAALAQRKNVLLDGVGADFEKMSARIEKLKAAGYHVRLVGVHLPPEEGMKRAAERALNSGRWVPLDEVVKPAYDKIPGNFQRLAELAHDAVAFDNGVPAGTPPQLMFSKQHGAGITMHDPVRYASYMGAYYEPPAPGAGTPPTASGQGFTR